MSSKSFVQITGDLNKGLKALHAEIPHTMKGFATMDTQAMKEGSRAALQKEAYALTKNYFLVSWEFR